MVYYSKVHLKYVVYYSRVHLEYVVYYSRVHLEYVKSILLILHLSV